MLLLIRHGQVAANAQGRLLGHADVGLTDAGREELRRLAPRLSPPAQLYSSPLRRAVESAATLWPGIPAVVDERWVELDYGEFDLAEPASLPPGTWAQWRADPTFQPPGGESLRSLFERVASAMEELFSTRGAGARSEAGDVAVVSHVSPIKAAVAWSLAADADLVWRLHLENA